jgi:hypothetical protein
MTKPKDRAKQGSPIKAPALNITLFSGVTLSLGAVLTRWQGLFEELFGYKQAENPGAAAAIFASLVLAIGLIVAGDLLARGIASSRVGDTATVPMGWSATLVTTGADETGYSVAAVRATAGGAEYLVVRSEREPIWTIPGDSPGQIKLHLPA